MLILLSSKSSGTWKDKGPSLLNVYKEELSAVEETWNHCEEVKGNTQLCLFEAYFGRNVASSHTDGVCMFSLSLGW